MVCVVLIHHPCSFFCFYFYSLPLLLLQTRADVFAGVVTDPSVVKRFKHGSITLLANVAPHHNEDEDEDGAGGDVGDKIGSGKDGMDVVKGLEWIDRSPSLVVQRLGNRK
jgi:hypothetical protein